MDTIAQKTRIADAELLRLVLAREPQGAEVLYDTYSKLVLLVIVRIIPQQALAEQLLESALIQVWNSADSYRMEDERFYTWVVRIARNLASEANQKNYEKEIMGIPAQRG